MLPAALALAAIALFLALGIWQVQRLSWKRALIAQVDARLAAAPVPAPGPAAWRGIGDRDAYTRVVVQGHYLTGQDTYTQALTEAGAGYWLLTPLATTGGWIVLVNRGFVPTAARGQIAPLPDPTRVSGLLRVAEPDGGFLRANDPAADRWHSRDVAAIAEKRGLARTAPYFIDADAGGSGWPRGGMTVVRFRNSHLVYALTWFGLAALVALLTFRALRRS